MTADLKNEAAPTLACEQHDLSSFQNSNFYQSVLYINPLIPNSLTGLLVKRVTQAASHGTSLPKRFSNSVPRETFPNSVTCQDEMHGKSKRTVHSAPQTPGKPTYTAQAT